jgi:hypothetical protein
MRPLVALAAAAAATATFAVPAHAEQVDIGVHVSSDFGATAYGTSTKPGETFGAFSIVRVSATDSLADPHVTSGGASVAGIAGTTTGVATYVVTAHPLNGDEPSPFFFNAVVACTKAAGSFTCTQSVGEHTVISLLPFG